MYNFYPKKLVQPPGCAFKILLMMKLTMLILITAILQVSARSYAQKITLTEHNAPLSKIFEQISQQTGYDFLVSTENLKASHLVTITVWNEELQTVLDRLFTGQPLNFVIQDKIVVVSKKEAYAPHPTGTQSNNPVIINGNVTDTAGKALPNATVKVKGSHEFVRTDMEGNFRISAQEGDEIEISFIGYRTFSFQAHADQAFQKIVLYTVASKLEDVTVVSTGYQTLPKERATGSFAQPIKAMYDDRVSTDVLSKLNGITSGLVFNANTTATQTGQPDINIRGRSTIFANDQPLIVVDNFPYSGDINNINPNDVESVTVLKDAASASIWGVRAGNGVIVITTKKGKLNQPLKVGFNASLTVFNKPDLNYNPNQLDASSYISLEKYLFSQGYYDANLNNNETYPVISPAVQLLASNRAGTLSTSDLNAELNTLSGLKVNNQLSKYFYQKAADQQYALTLSGGSDKANYYFSTGYDNDPASLRDNVNQRITINSQNTFYPVKNLEIDAGVNVVQTDIKTDNNLGQFSNDIFPYTQLVNAQGQPLAIPYQYSQAYVQNAPSKGFLDWSYAPLNELGATDNTTKVMDVRLTTGIRYTIVKGLSAEVKYQYENSGNQNDDYQSQQTFYARNLINEFSIVNSSGQVTGYNLPLGGILSQANATSISNNVRGQLNYNYSWKNNSLTALAGYELSQVSANSNSSTLYGYNNDLTTFTNVNPTTYFSTNPGGIYSTIPSGLGINSTLARLRSSFANAAYTYKDRYTLSASARVDGSNYFGVATNQKSLPLWSAGAKWDMSKEDFYKIDWLPVLALRATFGYNGNLDQSITGVTTFRYLSNAPYTNLNYAEISNIGNPDLQWEKTAIANLAIDFGTKNNVITGSLEYYQKRETDLLGYKSFPENSGITQLEGNYSDMAGHGMDLTINSRNLNGNIKWNTTLLFSHATDKVTHYDVAPYGYQLAGAGTGIPNVGKPVFGVYAYKWGGLDAATGNPIGYVNGAQSQDYATITTATPVNQLVYIGPARPTYFGGLNNRFSYKGFSLAVQINYKLGYYFMAPALSYSNITSRGAFLSVNRQFNQRWQYPGDQTNVPSMVYPFAPARDQFYQESIVNMQNADNIRLQDISLSYDFNKAAYRKLPFNNLQLFVYANNICILWKANHVGLDPDAVPGPADDTTMPSPRSLAIGLKGSF